MKIDNIKYYKFMGGPGPLCIGPLFGFTINKIYKTTLIIEPFVLNVSKRFIDNSGYKNGFSNNNSKYFIESTESEYNLQENISIIKDEETYNYLTPILNKLNKLNAR